MKKRSASRNMIGLLFALFISLMSMDVGMAQNVTVSITSVAWSPDGSKVAIGFGTDTCEPGHPEFYTIKVFDAQMTQIIQTFTGSLCSITSLDWSSDGTQLAASSMDTFGIHVWNVRTGQLLMSAQGGSQGVTEVRWRHPNDKALVEADVSNGVGLIDPSTGEGMPSARIGGTTVDWNPDGTKLLTGSAYENTVYVRDIATGEYILELEGHTGPINTVDWSPDGTKLASGGGIDDPTIRVWNASTGQNILTLNGHTAAIREVKWSPDSNRLASASSDGTVRIWDTTTGTELEVFEYPGRVYTVDWKPSGDYITFGGSRNDGQDATIEMEFVGLAEDFSLNASED